MLLSLPQKYEKERIETDKMDMNPENSIGEILKNAIKLYHRDEAAALLKKGALSQIPEEERTDVCKSLIALRDIKIADILAKDSSLFQPEILQLDFTSWNNREFIIKVLEKHRKRFQLNDEKTCEQLFEVACAADSADTVRFLLKQKKAVSRFRLLVFRYMSLACCTAGPLCRLAPAGSLPLRYHYSYFLFSGQNRALSGFRRIAFRRCPAQPCN